MEYLFVDQFLEIDIMCNNIYEIYPKYCKMLNQIYKFMNENINHINKNKIHAPLVADPDGWKCNLFYDLHTKDFIKKYDINDIVIKRWYDGIHYYAKVGKFDIIDRLGQIKYNSYAEAHAECLKWLEKQ